MDKIKGIILLSLIAPMWLAFTGSASAADVICYNCPPEWADWASMLRAIKADLGYDIPFDNKNSGQTLSQLIAEKNNPVADLGYYGVNFAIKAKAAGVNDAYKPKGHIMAEGVAAGVRRAAKRLPPAFAPGGR